MNKTFYVFTYSESPKFRPVEFKSRIYKIAKMVGSGNTVLDVGCGFGYISKTIKDQKNDVYGIEVSPEAVAYSKKQGIKVTELDLNDNWDAIGKKDFDYVILGEVIEHVFDTDTLLSKIHSMLRPGGHLIISTPNVASLGRRLLLLFGINPKLEYTARKLDAGHIRYFTFDNLCKLLEDNGFAVEESFSDYVTLDPSGNVNSMLLARIFPTLGRSLIIKAKRID